MISRLPEPPLERLPIPLLAWYHEKKRSLPWRETKEPYPVLVSEIMLQQTRVAAVLGYYPAFLAQFPTVADLAAAPEELLLKCWQGLGYYRRARSLQKAAQAVMERHGGVFPADYPSLRALPGVGDYTAGAVASISFGLPCAAVDGNVLRVVSRLTGDDRPIDAPAVRKEVTAALEKVMPLDFPGDFNQALMELGATVCLPNGAPLCDRCPVRELCVACRDGLTGVLPVRRPKKPRRVEERTVYLLFHGSSVALRRRPDKGLLAGLWEFPNTLAGEAPPVELPELAFAANARHIFTHVEWRMTALAGDHPGELPAGWVWVTEEELRHVYSVPSAFSPFLDTVFSRLREKGA